MTMFAGLDVGFKRTAVCVVDRSGRTVWRAVVDTHPEAIAEFQKNQLSPLLSKAASLLALRNL